MKTGVVVFSEGDCNTEVAEENGTIVVDEQVCRFDVTMDEAVCVEITIVRGIVIQGRKYEQERMRT